MEKYKKIDECRCCSSNDLLMLLDLNVQPLANSYHNNKCLQEQFPLQLMLCRNCFHLQLSVVVDPSIMFSHYLYVSGTTQTLKEYFDFFAQFTKHRYIEHFQHNPTSVLDIASNDGSQLDSYKRIGINTTGIDPAKNLCPICESKHHNTICDFFPSPLLLSKKFDIIVAQNVFAHTHDIFKFLEGCKDHLSDHGVLYIQTSQSNMILKNEFDTIYHEHLSFFNTLSMKTIVERSGLNLNNVFKFDIHGSSYVFEISKHNLPSNVNDIIENERKNGLYSVNTYDVFSHNAKKITIDLKSEIENFKTKKYKVVGYGAAAKGMTLLNFGKIHLDCIIDDNPLKQGLYTPGMNIPIHSIDILSSKEYRETKIVFIPLSWNFFDEIKKKITEVRNTSYYGDVFIRYFPSIKTS